MYTQIWNKYLPVIKILLKRSATAGQVFQLNVSDFEKPGPARKTGSRFNIQFHKGRAENLVHSSAMAKDLALVLLGDEVVKGLFMQNDYEIGMTSKYELSITSIAPVLSASESAAGPARAI